MYVDFYEKISKPIRHLGNGASALAWANRVLACAMGAAFGGFALWLAIKLDPRLIRYLLVCALAYIACTLIRDKLDRPRPYELYPIDALIEKDTKGKSFPSRHVFSATIISCALLWLSAPAGIAGFAATAALAAIRVAGGVHFPRDVIAGIALGLACGILGFWVI